MAWAPTQQRAFYTQIKRESGLEQNQANQIAYTVALSAPAEYRKAKMDLEVKLTHGITESLYNLVYAALMDGKYYGDNQDLV